MQNNYILDQRFSKSTTWTYNYLANELWSCMYTAMEYEYFYFLLFYTTIPPDLVN